MTRLDQALVARGLVTSRERGQALIGAGMVDVDGAVARTAAMPVSAGAAIRLLGSDHPWAGRGGVKLDAALSHFGIKCHDRVALDSGASTGGFTDVLLSRGARLVHAVDVGHGQLITRLATDPRVCVHDRTNVRLLESVEGDVPSLVTLDLSFISLRLVIPVLERIAPGAEVVALVKPQFELGRGAVGRDGVVKDEVSAAQCPGEFLAWAERVRGASPLAEPFAAPIRGARGNQEWLVHLRLPGPVS